MSRLRWHRLQSGEYFAELDERSHFVVCRGWAQPQDTDRRRQFWSLAYVVDGIADMVSDWPTMKQARADAETRAAALRV